MIKPELTIAYPSISFVMADNNPDLMRFANVFGAVKFSKLMRMEGLWE